MPRYESTGNCQMHQWGTFQILFPHWGARKNRLGQNFQAHSWIFFLKCLWNFISARKSCFSSALAFYKRHLTPSLDLVSLNFVFKTTTSFTGSRDILSPRHVLCHLCSCEVHARSGCSSSYATVLAWWTPILFLVKLWVSGNEGQHGVRSSLQTLSRYTAFTLPYLLRRRCFCPREIANNCYIGFPHKNHCLGYLLSLPLIFLQHVVATAGRLSVSKGFFFASCLQSKLCLEFSVTASLECW